MRAHALGFTCGLLALLGLAADANEPPTAEYVDAMQTLATVSKGLATALEARDHKTMNEHVIAARPALELVRAYWRDADVDGTDAAMEAVRAASKSISEISVAVHMMTLSPNPIAVGGAQLALKNLRAACTRCHAAHRVEQPDGTYLIK